MVLLRQSPSHYRLVRTFDTDYRLWSASIMPSPCNTGRLFVLVSSNSLQFLSGRSWHLPVETTDTDMWPTSSYRHTRAYMKNGVDWQRRIERCNKINLRNQRDRQQNSARAMRETARSHERKRKKSIYRLALFFKKEKMTKFPWTHPQTKTKQNITSIVADVTRLERISRSSSPKIAWYKVRYDQGRQG